MSETNTQAQAEAVTPSQQQQALLEQLLQPEVQASLSTLVEQLPKITELVTCLTKSYDVTKTLATDEIFRNDIVSATTEIVGPVVEGVRSVALDAIEAKDRAAKSQEVIGIFGLMKMLKDPQAQKMFRFVNAYLEVSNERSNKK
ncbi:MAG: DUF1641 domain-containing protein [Candidatus Pristimantibacillus lignocellulolyticus]|uniref:DUF1641 domain-containing protein n=1 Tax=Candidatus Pristimantibacillus lignocellulolyticus TaxID=2994561 RepID=A0A9J6ZK52_9BACL|nr:MAG: DUF1641 domain-containing protein [Candidatus Pristimantibacillus lignocellulolyticus]